MILQPALGTWRESFSKDWHQGLGQKLLWILFFLAACYGDLSSGLMGSAMPGFSWSFGFVFMRWRKFFWITIQGVILSGLMQFHWGRPFYHILFEFLFIYFVFFIFSRFFFQNDVIVFLNYLIFMTLLSLMNGIYWPLAFQHIFSRLLWSTGFFIIVNRTLYGKQKFSIPG